MRLAHDAVLASWPRASEAAQASREFYRVRAEVEDALRRWRESGQPKDRLIQPGVPLAEAEKLVEDFARELPPELIGFISASRHQARARQRLIAASAMFFFLLAVIATSVGIWAYRAQQQAIAQRTRAETSYAAARQTVEGLIFNIVGGLNNVEGMRTDALAKILDTARQTVEKLATNYPDDLALQRSRASMLHNFGLIYMRGGDFTRALPVALEALAMYRKLVPADPANAQWQRELASTLFTISILRRQVEGDYRAALQSAEENVAIRRRLADPDKLQYQADLAEALSEQQNIQVSIGDMEGARKSIDESLAIYRRLVAQFPGNADWQRGLADSLNGLALLLDSAGDFEGASKLETEALATLQKLDPGDLAYTGAQREYADSQDRIGDLQLQKGNMEAAHKSYEKSLVVRQRLAKQDPEDWRYQDDIAISLRKIGDWKLRTGDRTGAYKSYQDGIEARRQLVAHDPANISEQDSLAGDLDNLAKLQIGGGDLAAALKTYQESIEIKRKIAAGSPSSGLLQTGLGLGLKSLADLQLRMGDQVGARASLAEMVEILRRESNRDASAMSRGAFTIALREYGKLLQDMGDMDGAHKAFDESVSTSRELSADFPDQKIWAYNLAMALDDMGDFEIATKDIAGALKTNEEELAVLYRLTAADPDNADYRTLLWGCLDQIGDLAFALGENGRARDAWEQAVAVIRRALAMHDPLANEQNLATRLANLPLSTAKPGGSMTPAKSIANFFKSFAGTWTRSLPRKAGRAYSQLRCRISVISSLRWVPPETARTAFEESRDIRRKLLADQPSDVNLQADLGATYERLGNVLISQGKLDNSLAAYRNSLEIWKGLLAQDSGNAQWQQKLSGSLGSLAYLYVLARNFFTALEVFGSGHFAHARSHCGLHEPRPCLDVSRTH